MDSPNQDFTKEFEYEKIEMKVAGSKVIAYFPIKNIEPDIMAVIQKMLTSSYMDRCINTIIKKN